MRASHSIYTLALVTTPDCEGQASYWLSSNLNYSFLTTPDCKVQTLYWLSSNLNYSF